MISVVYVNPGCKSQEVTTPTPPHKLMLVKLPMSMTLSGDTDSTSALTSEDGSELNFNALLATAMNLVTDNDAL